jgi:uncharacterized protein YndB with AHSA1/START domain
MTDRIVRVSRTIPADAQAIFDVLADPALHPVIDGSGTVRDARPDNPNRLSPGARFRMSMKQGARYTVTNDVVEFTEGRRIAWRHGRQPVWRYILTPTDTGTEVTEEYDWGVASMPRVLNLVGFPKRAEKSMATTLERLEQTVTATGRSVEP